MGYRRQARELALQSLYLCDTSHLDFEAALNTVRAQDCPENILEFARHLANGVLGKKEQIDAILARYAENWELSRMAAVDRNILRLATLELLTDTETPVSVIINEAIEIAKTFSTEESGKFVNGILDKVKQERPAQPTQAE